MMFPFETDYIKVSLDETGQVAILHWKRTVDLHEYQDGMKAFIMLLEETGVNRSLMDSTLRGELTLESDAGVFKMLKTEVSNLYIAKHQVALVMTEKRYQELIQNYTLLQAGSLDLPINVNYFTRVDEAIHWLVHEDLSSK